MNLPEQYKGLSEIGQLPRIIQTGLQFLGLQEVVGKGSNKTILSWRDELNQAGVKISGYSDDDIPWCGLFAAFVVLKARGAAEVVKDPLWARNWAKYGVKADTGSLGDVLVFVRNGGGHVGFYIGEDAVCYHVLGGNQSNKVSITRIDKSRCIAIRRPPYHTRPATAKPFKVSAKGKPSTNEA